MKLNAIDIEKALQLSVAEAQPDMIPATRAAFEDMRKMRAMMHQATGIPKRDLRGVRISPPERQGQVESVLRRALTMLGPRGERWIQGTGSKDVGEQAVRVLKPLGPFALEALKDMDASTCVVQCELIYLGRYAHCAVGAMDRALNEGGWRVDPDNDMVAYSKTLDAFAAANRLDGIAFGSIPEWNDRPGRTFAEVRKAFENAIAYAHHKGI